MAHQLQTAEVLDIWSEDATRPELALVEVTEPQASMDGATAWLAMRMQHTSRD